MAIKGGANPLAYMGLIGTIPELIYSTSNPTTSNSAQDPGDFWVNTTLNKMFTLISKPGGVANWFEFSPTYDFQESVLAQAAIGVAVAAEGNRYLCNSTGGGWTDTYIYEYNDATWVSTVPSDGMVVFVEDTGSYLLYDAAAWGSFTTGITTIAAATDTNIAAPADAEMLFWDGVNSWDNHLLTGDASCTNAGVVSVSNLTITSEVQGDLIMRGAASWERLPAKTDKQILIGDGTDITSVAVTGDIAITNLGATTVTDLTMTGEAQGDVLYFDGTNWVVLPAGAAGTSFLSNGAAANPSWGAPAIGAASIISNGATLNDAGANDAILAFTTQTIGAPTLTVPDFASVADTFAFITLAQTLTNKTLTDADINGGTADSLTGFSIRSSGAAFDLEQDTAEVLSGNHKISWNIGDTDRAITLGGNLALGGTLTTLAAWTQTGAHTIGVTTTGATTITLPTTGTLITLAGAEELTNKTVTSGIIKTTAVFQQATANYTLSWADAAVARALSWDDPLGDDKFVFRDETVTFTNKTIDTAANTLTNVNGAELEVAAATTALGMAIPFIIKKDISNNLTTTLYTANFPQKARLIKAWVEETDNNTGNVIIDDGTNAICTAVSYGGTDTDVTDFPNIDDSKSTLAANATLRCLNSVATDDAMVYMMFIPIA